MPHERPPIPGLDAQDQGVGDRPSSSEPRWLDIANFASLPAHVVGTVTRDPKRRRCHSGASFHPRLRRSGNRPPGLRPQWRAPGRHQEPGGAIPPARRPRSWPRRPLAGQHYSARPQRTMLSRAVAVLSVVAVLPATLGAASAGSGSLRCSHRLWILFGVRRSTRLVPAVQQIPPGSRAVRSHRLCPRLGRRR